MRDRRTQRRPRLVSLGPAGMTAMRQALALAGKRIADARRQQPSDTFERAMIGERCRDIAAGEQFPERHDR